MKITVCCCTYGRPKQLAEMLWCYEHQTHKDRELVILDDANQYKNQEGDRWRLVSSRTRYPTLGDKRNASIALAGNPEYIAIWDDDDLYYPWALSAVASALAVAEFCRPSLVYTESNDKTLIETCARGMYHGAWGFHYSTWEKAGKYPPVSGPEDSFLRTRIERFATEADPMSFGFNPYYVYRIGEAGWSISLFDETGYDIIGRMSTPKHDLVATPPDIGDRILSENTVARKW